MSDQVRKWNYWQVAGLGFLFGVLLLGLDWFQTKNEFLIRSGTEAFLNSGLLLFGPPVFLLVVTWATTPNDVLKNADFLRACV